MGTFRLLLPPRLSRRGLTFSAIALAALFLSLRVDWPALWRNTFSSDYLPHSFCYLRQTKLIWLHLVSDMLIGAAYVAISFTLVNLVRRARREIPFRWMFLAFGLFIISCGMTHFMEVVVLWKPLYWFSGDIKVVTTFASVATAIALPRLVPQTLALIRDRRVRLEDANAYLEELNRRLVERDQIKTALVHATVEGVAGWEVTYPGGEMIWSEDPHPLFGRTAAELANVTQWVPIVHPEDRARVRDLWNDLLASRREYDLEYRIVRPDGAVRWLAARGHLYHRGEDETLRIAGLAIDITRRKQAEDALRTSEKLATAGRLAATIAHEINNPLEAVTNLLFLMRTNREPEYLAMAEQELERISHIVKQTLGFYRTQPHPTGFNLVDVIERVLSAFQGKARSRGVEVDIAQRSKGEMTGFSNELSQVFSNLISNALDAMGAGGWLRIRTVSCGDRVRVAIADNGAGISRENLDRIFQPFFTTNKEVGTGLGLWLSQEIVQKHGGLIRVKSRTDQRRHGTVFMIWLRRAPLTNIAAA